MVKFAGQVIATDIDDHPRNCDRTSHPHEEKHDSLLPWCKGAEIDGGKACDCY